MAPRTVRVAPCSAMAAGTPTARVQPGMIRPGGGNAAGRVVPQRTGCRMLCLVSQRDAAMAAFRTLTFLPLILGVAASAGAACPSPLLDVEFRPLTGKTPVNLCERYAGQVLLIVNTASKCGFTPQYEGLEDLHARLGDRGFAVLGFPSNDFMGQEPGTEEEIREFCTNTYGVRFPMFEKVTVKQGSAVPFYDTLAAQAGDTWPAWNFHKYLIGRDGRVAASFGSRTTPDDPALVEAIEAELARPAPPATAR
jgi:glutathione peroxidase